MEIGFVGLGKMGANMVRRLVQGGHQVNVFDRSANVAQDLQKEGAKARASLQELVSALPSPRVVWMMIPAGPPVDETIEQIRPHLKAGDILIDGGNTRFTDSIERSKRLAAHGILFVDAGTSGGIWGLKNGYCLMVGGEKQAIQTLEPVLKTLAPANGYIHAGPSGAGHYVKMVHNGIEYGMMQAYAEGFDMMKASRYQFDLPAIANLWNQGSVVRSWLLELAARALTEDPNLDGLKGYVEDSGEGRWTVEESIQLSVPTPVITASLQARFSSRRENTFSNKFLSALRNQFGGHAVKK